MCKCNEHKAGEVRARLSQAAELLQLEAGALLSSHTIDGEWGKSDVCARARAEHEELVTTATCLREFAAGCAANPNEEILRLRAALKEAESGMSLAYEALEKGCSDEALLHLGIHGARVAKALGYAVDENSGSARG